MTLLEFKKEYEISLESMCREFYLENKNSIKIKKEATVVRNLVKIVDTTLDISGKKGFDAMSLRDLSAESGLSMGALYSYFSSKDELLFLIQKFGQKHVKKILEKSLETVKNPDEKLRTFIRSHLYISELMHKWFYFFFMETKNMPEQGKKIPIESELMTEKMCIDIIKEGIKSGTFKTDDPVLVSSSVKALMQDWYLKRWKFSRRKIRVEKYAGHVINMIESFILIKNKKGLK